MTRQSYAHELVAAATVPVALATLEGGVIGSVARYTFDVSNLGFAALFAAPMFANVTSLAWSRLAVGRRKVPLITQLMATALVLIAVLGALPVNTAGAVMLVSLAVLARCLFAGFVNVRSSVWRANFPRHARAGITSRFMVLGTLLLAVLPIGFGLLLDAHPMAFRWLFPAAAAVAVVGVVSFSRIRLRGEPALLRSEQRGDAAEPADDATAPRQPDGRPHTALSILRYDHRFRRYMACQFCAGVSNMMGITAFSLYLVDRLKDHPSKFLLTMILVTTVPLLVASGSMPWWSRRLDRMHIARFRVLHGSMWIVNQALNGVAVVTGWLPVAFLTNATFGLVRGGGMPAWALGHNDFAHAALNAQYMAVHQTLTGIRGAAAPFAGALLFAGWGAATVPGTGVTVAGFGGIGAWLFMITTALAVAAWLGFLSLSRSLAAEGRDVAEDA